MSGCYFNKGVILKCNQLVACLWNASPAIFEMRSATVVIGELWAAVQPVCELQAVSRESYQSVLYQVRIISLHFFKSACKKK